MIFGPYNEHPVTQRFDDMSRNQRLRILKTLTPEQFLEEENSVAHMEWIFERLVIPSQCYLCDNEFAQEECLLRWGGAFLVCLTCSSGFAGTVIVLAPRVS